MFSTETKKAIKKGLHDAIGKWPKHMVILNAAGWLKIGVLDEAEFLEINAKIEALDAEIQAEQEKVEEE